MLKFQMQMKADVLAKSIDKNVKDGEKIIYLSPKGKLFNHQLAKQLSQEKTINIICGHFEGVDERLFSSTSLRILNLAGSSPVNFGCSLSVEIFFSRSMICLLYFL